MIVEGNISVKACLQQDYRHINCLYILDGKRSKDISYITALAKNRNIEVRYIDKQSFDNIVRGNTSGGVALDCEQRKYNSLNDIKDEHFLCLLDGIEDPFNLGYCLRSLYSFGCGGVILPDRDWSYCEAQILKSSAGASEKIKIYLSSDLISDVKLLKNNHTIVTAFRNNATSCLDYKWPKDSLLVVGGEMRGINKNLLQLSNQNIFIPYSNDFKNALNASSATSVLAYSYMENNR